MWCVHSLEKENTHWLLLFHVSHDVRRRETHSYLLMKNALKCHICWFTFHIHLTFFPLQRSHGMSSATQACAWMLPRSKPFSGALFIGSELGKSSPSLLLFHLPPAASTFFCPLIKRSTLTRGLSFAVYQLCRGRLCRQIQRRDGNIMWVDTDLLLQLEWNTSLICWEVLLPLILAPGGTVNTSDKKCHN